MARAEKKQRKDKGQMSVNPPWDVGPVLGGYRTVTLTQAVRIAAHLLAEATSEVARMFTPAEWDLIAEALKVRVFEPEAPNPAAFLASLIGRAQLLYEPREPASKDKAGAPLLDRVSQLSYLQAWAVVMAAQFRWEVAESLKDGEHWWEPAVRAKHLPRQHQE